MTEPTAKQTLETIAALLATARLGVLATDHAGQPYTSLVAFAYAPPPARLLFATRRKSRKFENLQANPNAALLVDDREASAPDLLAPQALSARGQTYALTGSEHAAAVALLAARHPQLAAFLADPATAVLALEVASFQLVRRFGEIEEVAPRH